ncbi:MAG: glycoside hydrolase family 2 protein [Ruminococcaceae bacterium]|nr:glycoside hydrolase family 2 protein [Oscillospiraceae bacterium]
MIISNWKMTYGEYKGLECVAPASMYSVLLQHGLIKDPFYGLNELESTPLSDKGCVFEAEFTVDKDVLCKEHVELVFLGLDTLCGIFVNGKLLSKTKNMHRRYIFDVKELISVGKNQLRLEFDSPVEYFKEMNEKHFLQTNGDTIPGAIHLRKALYMSGWDWGPTLPDMGIFRPVMIDAYDEDKIENIFVLQEHKNGEVTLDIRVETRHNTACDLFVYVDGKEIKLNKDKSATVKIDNPRLWWVRGYGEQSLYEITAKMVKKCGDVDEKAQKIGLRTLTVSTEKDETGSEFCFVLNGVKIFAMGANYVPQDNLTSRINPLRTEELIKDALDANFNTLRVWGGGYYPEDEFYDLCDRHGVLVWQDSMIACCNIWLNDEMKEELEEELIYNLKRLRHHPSLGMWCGNNEMEEAILFWDDYGRDDPEVRADYLRLYEDIFPKLLKEYAPQTFYWQASPSSGGNFDDPKCVSRGDAHFWDVWHGNKPFTEYRKHKFRFCSEYGFESYPSMKTIRTFCEPKDMNCFSRVMENHQKSKSGNSKILMYLADTYLYPNSFEALVYASQLLQADAIKYGVEHFRRLRGYTMGSIYWQFNDCWPVASWSSVDSLGRYKALHYAAKKFYAPVSMGLFLENNALTVNVSNERTTDFSGSVKVYFSDTSFNVLKEFHKEINVSALTSKDVLTVDGTYENKYGEYMYAQLYDKDGSLIMTQTELFVPPKFFEWKKPSFSVDIQESEGGATLTISADTFAKGVYIDFEDCDPTLSSNFFDLVNGEKYTVHIKTDTSAEALKSSLKILSVYDIGK